MSTTTKAPNITKQDVIEAFEPETRTQQYKGVDYGWTDARSIREEFGLSPFWKQLYETSDARRIDTTAEAVKWPDVVPDCLIHLRSDERDLLKMDEPPIGDLPEERRHVLRWLAADDDALQSMSIGGTDFLGTGQPGSGKSTLACDLVRQIIEINPRESVIWRGTPSRAEWTPLAKWTKLLLPSGLDATVTVQPPTHGAEQFELDVEQVAREVERYDDPFDLLDLLEPGKVHVVYPDPQFSGCDDVFYRSSRTQTNFSHTSKWEATKDDPPTPLNHWWFAWICALVDEGSPAWVSQFIDEIGDLLPQAARAGEKNHYWYEKIELTRDAIVDARKNNNSFYLWGHNEADVSDLVRRKLRWRISMPGWPNPTKGDNVVGLGTAPMEEQHTKYYNVGKALWWTALYWSEIRWSDLPKPTAAKITVDFPEYQEVRV